MAVCWPPIGPAGLARLPAALALLPQKQESQERMRASLSLLAKKAHRSCNERLHTLIQQQEGSRSRRCSGSRCTCILPWTRV